MRHPLPLLCFAHPLAHPAVATSPTSLLSPPPWTLAATKPQPVHAPSRSFFHASRALLSSLPLPLATAPPFFYSDRYNGAGAASQTIRHFPISSCNSLVLRLQASLASPCCRNAACLEESNPPSGRLWDSMGEGEPWPGNSA